MYCQLNHYLKILTVGEILGSLSRWLTHQVLHSVRERVLKAWREHGGNGIWSGCIRLPN